MSKFLTKEIAERAVELSLLFIDGLMQDGLAKRHEGYLVVYRVERSCWMSVTEKSLGNPEGWLHDYEAVAKGKADITCRTGLSTREVQFLHPELIEPGDTVYYGSAVGKTIVVAFSGVDAWVDELIATVVYKTCATLVQHELERQKASGCTTFQPAALER